MYKRELIILILQEEFLKNGYKTILNEKNENTYHINLDDIFDVDNKPSELIEIYISEQQDELFFIIDGNKRDINELCDIWDDRIRIFTILNGKDEVIQRFKYNIIQIIICSNDMPDRNRERNLCISRKIILKGKIRPDAQVYIDDDEAIELPFYMISAEVFLPDKEQINELEQLLPSKNDNILDLLKKKRKKMPRRNRESNIEKSFDNGDFKKIKRWLES